MKPGVFVRTTRINFLPASVIPFLTGVALAFREGASISPLKLLLGLFGIASAHLAGNLFNDYFDHKSGVDSDKGARSPFFGGSGVIQEGLAGSAQVLKLALFFLSAAILCGSIIFMITADPVILFMMLSAGFLTLGYTAPPFKFAYKKLGELDIFFLFGIFMVMGSFYLMAGKFSLGSFLVSLPVSFLILAVIICNEVPDVDSDTASGKRNLIYVLGKERGWALYSAVVALSYIAVLFIAVTGLISPLAAGLIFLYPLGFSAALLLRKRSNDTVSLVKASGMTIALHALAGTGVIIAIMIR